APGGGGADRSLVCAQPAFPQMKKSTAARTAGFINLRNKADEYVIRIEIIFRGPALMGGAVLPLVLSSATLNSITNRGKGCPQCYNLCKPCLCFPTGSSRC